MSMTGNILVVDDEIVQQTVLATKLSMDGYTVTTAQGGRQALEFLRAQPFDLVLLDLLMPEIDGFQVLERMKADNALQYIPVIVIMMRERYLARSTCRAPFSHRAVAS